MRRRSKVRVTKCRFITTLKRDIILKDAWWSGGQSAILWTFSPNRQQVSIQGVLSPSEGTLSWLLPSLGLC